MKRVQFISLLASLGLLGIVLELVRRRMLKERFALLWIFSAAGLVVLSVWGNLLEILAKLVGIYYAPAVLLPIIIFFGVVLFLYFSVIVTKQADRIKTLAQKLALLEQQVEDLKQKERDRK